MKDIAIKVLVHAYLTPCRSYAIGQLYLYYIQSVDYNTPKYDLCEIDYDGMLYKPGLISTGKHMSPPKSFDNMVYKHWRLEDQWSG